MPRLGLDRSGITYDGDTFNAMDISLNRSLNTTVNSNSSTSANTSANTSTTRNYKLSYSLQQKNNYNSDTGSNTDPNDASDTDGNTTTDDENLPSEEALAMIAKLKQQQQQHRGGEKVFFGDRFEAGSGENSAGSMGSMDRRMSTSRAMFEGSRGGKKFGDDSPVIMDRRKSTSRAMFEGAQFSPLSSPIHANSKSIKDVGGSSMGRRGSTKLEIKKMAIEKDIENNNMERYNLRAAPLQHPALVARRSSTAAIPDMSAPIGSNRQQRASTTGLSISTTSASLDPAAPNHHKNNIRHSMMPGDNRSGGTGSNSPKEEVFKVAVPKMYQKQVNPNPSSRRRSSITFFPGKTTTEPESDGVAPVRRGSVLGNLFSKTVPGNSLPIPDGRRASSSSSSSSLREKKSGRSGRKERPVASDNLDTNGDFVKKKTLKDRLKSIAVNMRKGSIVSNPAVEEKKNDSNNSNRIRSDRSRGGEEKPKVRMRLKEKRESMKGGVKKPNSDEEEDRGLGSRSMRAHLEKIEKKAIKKEKKKARRKRGGDSSEESNSSDDTSSENFGSSSSDDDDRTPRTTGDRDTSSGNTESSSWVKNFTKRGSDMFSERPSFVSPFDAIA